MSSRKLFLSSIVTLLFVIDIVFGVLLLKMTDVKKESNNDYYKYCLIEYCDLAASAKSQEIEVFIDSLNCNDYLDIYASLGIIIPPNPCNACLNIQSEILTERFRRDKVYINILSPIDRLRDIKAKFNGLHNVKYIPYQPNGATFPIQNFDGIIYCSILRGHIYDVYLSSKWSQNSSELFLSSFGGTQSSLQRN